MYFITLTPNTMPRKVAMAIPKMPARMPGTTIELHPIAVANPHAVVGPPTFAFDAKSKSERAFQTQVSRQDGLLFALEKI